MEKVPVAGEVGNAGEDEEDEAGRRRGQRVLADVEEHPPERLAGFEVLDDRGGDQGAAGGQDPGGEQQRERERRGEGDLLVVAAAGDAHRGQLADEHARGRGAAAPRPRGARSPRVPDQPGEYADARQGDGRGDAMHGLHGKGASFLEDECKTSARRDRCDLAAGDDSDVCRAFGALEPALCVEGRLGARSPPSSRASTPRRLSLRPKPLRRVRRHLAGQVPGDGRDVGTVLAGVRAVPGLPASESES